MSVLRVCVCGHTYGAHAVAATADDTSECCYQGLGSGLGGNCSFTQKPEKARKPRVAPTEPQVAKALLDEALASLATIGTDRTNWRNRAEKAESEVARLTKEVHKLAADALATKLAAKLPTKL